MSNYKNFLSHNQDKLENFNSKNKLLIVDRGRLHQIFHASIFALAFNKKKRWMLFYYLIIQQINL